jgi:NADPH-dependent curcumin reductase CurA
VQLARDAGARVVGIAGGERKRRHLLDVLGADTAIDYTAGNLVPHQATFALATMRRSRSS